MAPPPNRIHRLAKYGGVEEYCRFSGFCPAIARCSGIDEDRGMNVAKGHPDEIRLIAVRHGETEANAAGRYSGKLDTPLTQDGVEQARALGERFRNVHFDVIYSSDLSRARNTARAIARHHDMEPIIDPNLRERGYGEMEGLAYGEARSRFPEVFSQLDGFVTSYPIPGGESADQVRERVTTFVERIVREHQGQTVVAAAHGGILRALFWHLLELPYRVVRRSRCDNTAVSVFRYRKGVWMLEMWNDTGHLEESSVGASGLIT